MSVTVLMKVRFSSRTLCFLYINVNTKVYRHEMLPAVLYGCGTWHLALREEHKLKALMLFISMHCDWNIHSQNQRTHS
jgi:hypothetical protein